MSADPTYSSPAALQSAALPSPAVIGLVPSPAHDEASELRAQLRTERSAGRALLTTVNELDARLQAERTEASELREAVARNQAQIEAQREDFSLQTTELWSELLKATHELNKHRQRSLWERVVNRPV